MVNQFKFSNGKLKNAFNNAVSFYITKLRVQHGNPKITDRKQEMIDEYFARMIDRLQRLD